jgi:hypothetical protein
MIYISGDMWVEIDKDFTKAQMVVEVEVNVDVGMHENGDT